MSLTLDEIVDSIVNIDSEGVVEKVKAALSEGFSPQEIIEHGISKGLRTVGKMYEDGDIFLIHLVAAAEPAKKVVNELLEPEMKKHMATMRSLGKVVIGTVKGDIHTIGKDIVAAMLFAAGFEVYDLGTEVSPQHFLEKANEIDADIVAASALLTTTMPVQREIVKAFKEAGIRDKVKLIFGGAPVDLDWVEEIGGDGYAKDAMDAVKLVKNLLNINEE